MNLRPTVAVLALLWLTACSGEEYGSATFTTWGGAAVEDGIDAGEGGFIDGWSLKYDKFLVNFHQIEFATSAGEIAGTVVDSFFVDNVVPGRKRLMTFDDVTAKTWDRVSYEIKPAVASARIIAGDPADLEMMVEAGYSLYIEGSATRRTVTKTFALGFASATQYRACHLGGTAGLVVSDGAETTTDLTTHGQPFFFERLPSAGDTSGEIALRFANVAAADDNGDADGNVTLDELEDQPLDETRYDPGELAAENMKDFVTGLARTVGHFQGAGDCTISEAE